jgi:heptosyltransferase-2
MSVPATDAAASRPLIVRIRNWVGDVVLGLPALRLLQANGYQLHLVARGKWAPALLAGEDWAVHVQPAGVADKVAQWRALREQCRAVDPGFDQRENTLLLPVSLSSALEARLAGLRAFGVAKEGRSVLLARSTPVVQEGHELARYFEVACRFLRVQAALPASIGLRVDAAKAAAARALLAAQGVDGRYAMVCPFAGGRSANTGKPSKTWPAFAEFAALAANRLGLPIVLYPGPGEHEAARRDYPGSVVLDGSDLAIYAPLLQRAALVVANDTGPGHMAAALDTPVISVLGPTTAARWAPWGPSVQVLQKAPAGDQVVWPSAAECLALAQRLLSERAGS